MHEGNPHSLQILSIFPFLPAISEICYDYLTVQNAVNCFDLYFKVTSKSLQSHFKVFEAGGFQHDSFSAFPAVDLLSQRFDPLQHLLSIIISV